jgi:hypothetical protein
VASRRSADRRRGAGRAARVDWPVYLTAAALTLLGVVDLPVAVGGTVLYLVAKSWPVSRDQPAATS